MVQMRICHLKGPLLSNLDKILSILVYKLVYNSKYLFSLHVDLQPSPSPIEGNGSFVRDLSWSRIWPLKGKWFLDIKAKRKRKIDCHTVPIIFPFSTTEDQLYTVIPFPGNHKIFLYRVILPKHCICGCINSSIFCSRGDGSNCIYCRC